MADHLMQPLIQAGQDVMAMFTSSTPIPGELSKRTLLFTTQEVSILIGVSGSVRGQVIFGMSEATAIAFAGVMMGSEETEFDEMVASAICELGNIISGNAVTLFEQFGHQCDLTPPAIVRGHNVQLATQHPAVVTELQTEHGIIEINMSLQLR